ncbi:hypothetical protein GE09DRAFT_1067027 [Coniochaeta sp. 2T2.1]|nr:hypothetical protein GE09DRAFT_1067027 [Coniochaeta sp. 2T2.1]
MDQQKGSFASEPTSTDEAGYNEDTPMPDPSASSFILESVAGPSNNNVAQPRISPLSTHAGTAVDSITPGPQVEIFPAASALASYGHESTTLEIVEPPDAISQAVKGHSESTSIANNTMHHEQAPTSARQRPDFSQYGADQQFTSLALLPPPRWGSTTNTAHDTPPFSHNNPSKLVPTPPGANSITPAALTINDKPFICPVQNCKRAKEGYTRKETLESYMTDSHDLEGKADHIPKMPFLCPVKECSRSKDGFPRKENVVKHLKKAHGIGVEAAEKGKETARQRRRSVVPAVYEPGVLTTPAGNVVPAFFDNASQINAASDTDDPMTEETRAGILEMELQRLEIEFQETRALLSKERGGRSAAWSRISEEAYVRGHADGYAQGLQQGHCEGRGEDQHQSHRKEHEEHCDESY